MVVEEAGPGAGRGIRWSEEGEVKATSFLTQWGGAKGGGRRAPRIPKLRLLVVSPCWTAALARIMHEIVTLQLGEQANHVGSHFWNTQVSAAQAKAWRARLTALLRNPTLPMEGKKHHPSTTTSSSGPA